jgi:hypothetical protein
MVRCTLLVDYRAIDGVLAAAARSVHLIHRDPAPDAHLSRRIDLSSLAPGQYTISYVIVPERRRRAGSITKDDDDRGYLA